MNLLSWIDSCGMADVSLEVGHMSKVSAEFIMKRELDSNLYGNEVCYTNSLILLVKNLLCSRLHRQKGFN